jgi:hypothetical protein
MRTHVEFYSTQFPPYPDEEEQINPGVWGKRLAEYLKTHLQTHGIPSGEIFVEDWGVGIPIEGMEHNIWIGCASYQDNDNSDGFLCFIEPSKGYIRKWFRKIDISEKIQRVADTLDLILKNDPDIRDINWWKGK